MIRPATPASLESPMARALVEYQKRRGITWDALAEEIGIQREALWAAVYEKWDMTLPTLHRIARYFVWDAIDVGIVAMYVPKGAREKQEKKEGKRESKKAQQIADADRDGPPR